MYRSTKLGWTARTVAVPLLLSLALHGLLVTALWFWPARTPPPTLSIESTRITLETCVLDSRASTVGPEREFPADLLGSNVNTTFAPQLQEAPPLPSESTSSTGPKLLHEGKPSSATAASNSPSGDESAGGSGGGSLFPLPATATSVVYVLDRSVSMGMDRKLDFARRELIASLRRLPPSARFQVIDYNDYAEVLVLDGRTDLLPAEPAIVDKAVTFLRTLEAGGNTNHVAALRRALNLHADVIYFLTDADELKPEQVALLTQQNRGSAIHTIELTRRRAAPPEGPLARLACDNRGTYRRVALVPTN